MNSISRVSVPTSAAALQAALPSASAPSSEQLEVRETFQDFVAGTFYKQMFKALRSTQHKPAYFHGGQAEEIFQGQMDQHIAEELARDHGAEFAGPFYTTFAAHLRSKLQQQAAPDASASHAPDSK